MIGQAYEYVRVWTVQPAIVWQTLQRTKILFVDPSLCTDLHDWQDSYEWMCHQMQLRLQGYRGHFPWWAWYRHSIRQSKPHLNYLRWHSGTAGEYVRIELLMPKEMVLLSCLPAWEAVINSWYISYTLQEAEQWFKKEKDAGLGSSSWPYPEPWRQHVEATWPRIFDLEGLAASEIWAMLPIQATFEILDLQYVARVDVYTAFR